MMKSGLLLRLKEISKYLNSDFNLKNIEILRKKFKCDIGLSDHSKDNLIAALAVSQGAVVIEKHIALDNQIDGLDIDFSIKGKEIKEFKAIMNDTYELLGKSYFYRDPTEEKSKGFRRSIFVVQDIKKDEKFTTKNIRRIRPGNGIEPKYYEILIGKKSPHNYKSGEPIKSSVLKQLNIKKK